MKKIVMFLIISVLWGIPVLAAAPHTVTFTCSSTDFAADENIMNGPYRTANGWTCNTVKNIYVTWDANSIYIGTFGITSVNSNDFWLNFSKNNGASGDVSSLDLWDKKITITGWTVNYVWHSYMPGESAEAGYNNFIFLNLDGGAATDDSSLVTQSSDGAGSCEIAIPWSLIGLQANQVIKIVATITGNNYDAGSSLPLQNPAVCGCGNKDVLNVWMQGTVTNGSLKLVSGSPKKIFSQTPVKPSKKSAK